MCILIHIRKDESIVIEPNCPKNPMPSLSIQPRPLPCLDHILLIAEDAQPTLRFLLDVAGLRIGSRPPFRFEGWWLYAGAQAVVHLVGRPRANERPGAGPAVQSSMQAAACVVDHIAFRLADADAVRNRLALGGWAYREARVPGTGERQFFVQVPLGPSVELVFDAEPQSVPVADQAVQ